MRSKDIILMSAFLICSLISSNPLVAQSKDRNNPTPVQSPVISALTSTIGEAHWYKLTAGPGELAIKMEVRSCRDEYRCGSNARFVLYDKHMKEVMNESLSAIGYGAGTGKNRSLMLQSKHDFLLSVTPGKVDSADKLVGTYTIRFKGPIDLQSERK